MNAIFRTAMLYVLRFGSRAQWDEQKKSSWIFLMSNIISSSVHPYLAYRFAQCSCYASCRRNNQCLYIRPITLGKDSFGTIIRNINPPVCAGVVFWIRHLSACSLSLQLSSRLELCMRDSQTCAVLYGIGIYTATAIRWLCPLCLAPLHPYAQKWLILTFSFITAVSFNHYHLYYSKKCKVYSSKLFLGCPI